MILFIKNFYFFPRDSSVVKTERSDDGAYIYPPEFNYSFIYIQYFGIQKDNFEIICGYNLNLNILMLALHQQQFIFIEPAACVHNEH